MSQVIQLNAIKCSKLYWESVSKENVGVSTEMLQVSICLSILAQVVLQIA